ncbi:hypothetical protein GH714_035640 [Hevea brasiliensis]|uniref:Uncharacterized protein n=1 Tax=Hevea brasiliensis TaxID=3981 RepID=A0A6A6KUD6_HEVBR|nr:hypothetical protein GH714_035640 [Hevea brasiliensis]
MSPASKSKSKDKKAGKEPQKASSKPSGPANAGSGIPASAYNPLSGTFHALEIVPMSSASPRHANGRYQNIDETDDHLGGSLGTGVEYDSVSNNGSWSGKVEDSVSWLFEVGEDADKNRDQKLGGGKLKIDISEEHARLADMEIRYKCNKQEVERAVVASEGDLEKAAESLRELKLDPPAAPLKSDEETGDPPS